MENLEKAIIKETATLTLANLNRYFIKNNNLSKDEFMKIQENIWKEIKNKYNINLT